MKKIKTIIRTEKIKSIQQLHNIGAHNNRLKDVPNASPIHDIKRLIGTTNLVQDVKKLMSNKGINIDKLRKNAVLCNELLLSLSPEFFEDNELDYRNKFNRKNTLDFIKKAKTFLVNKYGDNLVHLSVHLDESTPHVHAVVVPTYLDSVTGTYKLAAKRLFDRPDLQLLQKEYCETFKSIKEYHFSYQEKSTAKHQDLKSFYKNLDDTKKALTVESLGLKQRVQLLENKNKVLVQDVKSSLIEKINLTDELITEQEKVLKLEKFINKLRNVFVKKEDKFFKKYLDNNQGKKKSHKKSITNEKPKSKPSNDKPRFTPNDK